MHTTSKSYPHQLMNKPKQKARQAFLDEIKEVERRHGMRLAVIQPPPQMVVEEFAPEEPATD